MARIHGLIDEATRIPSIERITFTGGECFLLGGDLDALVAHARDLGFATRVITNGYWAVNERGATDRVAGLQKAGLDEMMISTGSFHQRFVPVARIVHAARAAATAGILTRISIEECDQSTFDDVVLREQLDDLIAMRRVFLSHDPWIPDAGSRGSAALSHGRLFRDDQPPARGRCAQILSVISVTPDQQLVACCGFPLEELPRLQIGSVADRALDDLVAGTPNELLKMWLHVSGPSGIAEFVARRLPGFTLPATASICQACVALQRDSRAMQIVSEHAAEIVQSVAHEFVQLQGGLQPLEAF